MNAEGLRTELADHTANRDRSPKLIQLLTALLLAVMQ